MPSVQRLPEQEAASPRHQASATSRVAADPFSRKEPEGQKEPRRPELNWRHSSSQISNGDSGHPVSSHIFHESSSVVLQKPKCAS